MTPADWKAARSAFDMTQREWAEALGVGREYVAELETQADKRPSRTLVLLVEAYLRHGLPTGNRPKNLRPSRRPVV